MGELEGWDIKSAKGQRHFYCKVRTWGFLALANTYLTNVPQGKLFLLTIQPLFPQGIASIHLFLGRVIRPLRALCCHGYTASGTCTAQPGQREFQYLCSVLQPWLRGAILWVSLQVKTTEKVKITFGIPEQTEMDRTFILFGVSFLTSKLVGFLTVILKNRNFRQRAKHKYVLFFAVKLNIVDTKCFLLVFTHLPEHNNQCSVYSVDFCMRSFLVLNYILPFGSCCFNSC